MTEREWLRLTNPSLMLRHLTHERTQPRVRSLASDRQLRLFACACVRRVWPHLADKRGRQAVVTAEQFADGLASAISLEAACAAATRTAHWEAHRAAPWSAHWAAHWAAHRAADRAAHWAARAADSAAHWAAHRAVQPNLLRDIVGNPFRPRPVFSADWRTSSVLSISTAIYQDRAETGELDPVGLLMLSDAMEDVGCVGEVLDHLRSPGLHVRGCWALDLVLGKE